MAGITIIGGPAVGALRQAAVARAEIKRAWWEAWQSADDLEIVRVSWGTSQEIGELELRRRYAAERAQPYQAGFSAVSPTNLMDWWVRVRLLNNEGSNVVWCGRIVSERRDVYSSPSTPSGHQVFVAAEPMRLLDRIAVGESFWPAIPPLLKHSRLGWTPAFNSEDDTFLAGNRSQNSSNGSHTFGGTRLWARYEMLFYVLRRFVDESLEDPDTASPEYDPVGPYWSIGGQNEALISLLHAEDRIEVSSQDTAGSLLRRIVSPGIGVDFRVVYLPDAAGNGSDGFEVRVFSLMTKAAAFGGIAYAPNTDEVRLTASDQDASTVTRIVRSHDQRFKRIRVVGRRVVACCTLKGAKAVSGGETASLVPRWSTQLQAEYDAGTGTTEEDKEKSDIMREADRFEPVYQFYGAPDDWEFNDFLAFPNLDNEGNFITDASPADPQYQTTVRRTLSYLPLRTGWDYTTLTPVDRNPAGVRGEPMQPQAWIKAPEDAQGVRRYRPADQLNFAVDPLNTEWGLSVNGKPNHALAAGHFGNSVTVAGNEPVYDYEEMVATIAFETDTRLELVYEEPNWRPSDGELLIETDAELWFAAPGTVVGVNNQGGLITTPTSAQQILRKDSARLYLTMAGAVARYAQARARAEVTTVGLYDAAAMIGRVLTVVESGSGDSIEINAPVTAAEWVMGSGGRGDGDRTVLKAGYAR